MELLSPQEFITLNIGYNRPSIMCDIPIFGEMKLKCLNKTDRELALPDIDIICKALNLYDEEAIQRMKDLASDKNFIDVTCKLY